MRFATAIVACTAASCVAPVEEDVRERLDGAELLLVATAGAQVRAWLATAASNVVLDLEAGESAYLWPIHTATGSATHPADLVAGAGGRLPADLDVSVLAPDFARAEEGGACKRCLAEAAEMPQRLFPGDSCRMPPWIAGRAIEPRDRPRGLDAPAPADVFARITIEVPGACDCDTSGVSTPPPAGELHLEAVTLADEPWPVRAAAAQSDGATALFSERSFRRVDASGQAATAGEPSGLEGPVLGATIDGQGGYLVLTVRGAQPVLRKLGPRLEPQGERVLPAARAAAVRRIAETSETYVIGRDSVIACGAASCEETFRGGNGWGDQSTATVPFTELLRMPDGTLAAITSAGDVAFGVKVADRWTWRGAKDTSGPHLSTRCADATQCGDGTTLVPSGRIRASRLGAHLVICGPAALGAARARDLIWERPVSSTSDPRAGWTVVADTRANGACAGLLALPAEGNQPEAVLVLGASGAELELVEENGAVVARAPVSPPDFGFVPAAVSSEGARWVATSRDGAIARAPKARGARFTKIAGPSSPPDPARWAGPVLAAGDHFVAVGADMRLTRVTVPAVGAIDVAAPAGARANADCTVTAAARDPGNGEILIAGWGSCRGLFRAREDGSRVAVPLDGAALGQPIDVLVASARDDFVLATMGPSLFRFTNGALTKLETTIARPGGTDLRCAAPLLSPPIDRTRGFGADLWRSGSAHSGVVWLGGCDSVGARVIGSRVEAARSDELGEADFTTTLAFCPDHAAWVANGPDGAGSAWEVGPGSMAQGRWSAYGQDAVAVDLGTPTAVATSQGGTAVFWRDDGTRTASGDPGGSIVEIRSTARTFYPVSFRFAATDAKGVTLVTADGGRVYAIRGRR